MGSRVMKDCCETKNSSSNLNLNSEYLHSFEFQDDEYVPIHPVTYSDYSPSSKGIVSFASNYIFLNTVSLEVPACYDFECPQALNLFGNDFVIIIELSDATSDWLDMVKLSLLSFMAHLNSSDRVGIVGFNNKVTKLSGLIAGTVSGKYKLEKIIREIRPEGTADVLEAVRLSLYMLKTRLFFNNNSSIILFSATPDEFPETALERADHITTLFKDLEYSFYSFGLGAAHNSELLNFLSLTGTYTHISHPNTLSSSFASLVPAFFMGKIHHLTLSLSVSSLIPVEISKVFHHPSSVEFGKHLNIVFLLNFRDFNEDTKDRVYVNAKISHKHECFESNSSIDVYGKAWVVQEVELDEKVWLEFLKEKVVQSFLVAVGKDYESGLAVIEETIYEMKTSVIAGSQVIEKFLIDIGKVKEEVLRAGMWTEETKAKVYNFIRNIWGKKLKGSYYY